MNYYPVRNHWERLVTRAMPLVTCGFTPCLHTTVIAVFYAGQSYKFTNSGKWFFNPAKGLESPASNYAS